MPARLRHLGHLTHDRVIDRARSVVGTPCVYALREGGRDPFAAHPGAKCDCSGFVAWCYGVDRFLDNAGVPHLDGRPWFETTTIAADAISPFGFVAEIDWTNALPGDLLVWGDRNGKQGHIGIVSVVGDDGPSRVIHCSSGNFKLRGKAILDTDVAIFKRNRAIAARVAWVS